MQPDTHEKARPGQGTGDLGTDSTGGGIPSTITDFDGVMAEAWAQLTGGLMHQSGADARVLLLPAWAAAHSSADVTVLRIYASIVRAVDAGLDPTPLAVCDFLRRDQSYPALPGFVRGEIQVRVHQLYGAAPSTAYMTAHARGMALEGAVWTRALRQVTRVAEAAAASVPLIELADLMQNEFGSVPAYLAAVLGEVS